jgi:hypothetical protein
MRQLRTIFLVLSVVAIATILSAQDDDSQPSLADVARQTRLQKQKEAPAQASDQSKDEQDKAGQPGNTANKDIQAQHPSSAAISTSGKDASPAKASVSKDALAKDNLAKGSKKVITNEELPEHVGPTSTLPQGPKPVGGDTAPNYGDGKLPADYWKNQIQTLKQSISLLESQIQDVTDSIRYSGGNCVSNCEQWNAQQAQKEQRVKMMTSQLEQQQTTLESMQDEARKQGYGSSIYDP